MLPPNDSQRVFENLWHVIEFYSREEQATMDRFLRAVEVGVEQYHRMLLLTAAIVAFVPPLLNQQQISVNRWFIRQGMGSLFITFLIGIVTLVATRYTSTNYVKTVRDHYRRRGHLIGEASVVSADKLDDSVGAAIAKGDKESDSLNREWTRRFLIAGIWEVSFYLSFLYGVWCLFRAAYLA